MTGSKKKVKNLHLRHPVNLNIATTAFTVKQEGGSIMIWTVEDRLQSGCCYGNLEPNKP